MVKNFKNLLLQKICHTILKLDMEYYVLKLYKVYINDDPELTLAYFTTMSNLENGGPRGRVGKAAVFQCS